jgi:hypothetical protein
MRPVVLPPLSWPGAAGLLWVTAQIWHLLDGSASRLRRSGCSAGGRCLAAEGVRVAGSDVSGAGWRVFLSHTSELRDFPPGTSYVAAAERAVTAAGHVIVDMADFPAASQPAAQVCADRVRGCEVYVGVLGTRYGSPVRDKPQVSYTELEFDTATDAGLDRLVFLLDTDAADVGIPPSRLIDLEFGARQDAFRRRVQGELTTQLFASPPTLGQLVERSLRELAESRPHSGTHGGQAQATVVAGEIPQEPLGFQPRADLVAALDAPGPGSRVVVVRAVTGVRGVGKTHLAAAYARAKLADRWRLVAWINAEDVGGVHAGLAAVAAGWGLDAGGGDAEAAGRAVRHRLEIDGDRCLLVFDNATDSAVLQPFIPAAGAARVIITSNQRSVANLGVAVPVDVFSELEALAFLAERTGLADAEGARPVAAELGYLPLALAQAAAVIADQHLDYGTYLDRLRAMPVGELLRPVEAGQYPRGVAAAVLLSLEGVRAGDDTGVCTAVMELLAVLSPAGVRPQFADGRRRVLEAVNSRKACPSEKPTEKLLSRCITDGYALLRPLKERPWPTRTTLMCSSATTTAIGNAFGPWWRKSGGTGGRRGGTPASASATSRARC